MANFEDLTDELAAQFDLGPGAEARRGLDGFLEKFEQAGLGAEVETWRGRCGGAPLSVRQVKKVLGAEAIKQLAKNLAVPQGFASKLLGHAIPTIIGRLTAEGAVSEAIPTFVPVFPHLPRPSWSLSAVGLHGGAQIPLGRVENGRDTAGLRLVTATVAVLVTLALFGYAISSGVAVDHSAAIAAGQGPAVAADTIEPASAARELTGDIGVQAEIKNPKAEPDKSGSAATRSTCWHKVERKRKNSSGGQSARVIGIWVVHHPFPAQECEDLAA